METKGPPLSHKISATTTLLKSGTGYISRMTLFCNILLLKECNRTPSYCLLYHALTSLLGITLLGFNPRKVRLGQRRLRSKPALVLRHSVPFVFHRDESSSPVLSLETMIGGRAFFISQGRNLDPLPLQRTKNPQGFPARNVISIRSQSTVQLI